MVEMVSRLLNGKYQLTLPIHRADRPHWYTEEGWERQRLAAMEQAIEPGDTVVDVGAEEGDMSALCAKWAGPEGGMILIEPNPRVWPNIRAIWEGNDDLAPILDWFVGFASAVTELHPPNDNVTDISKPVKHLLTEAPVWPECAYGEIIGDHGFRHLAQEADATPQIRLDEFIREAAHLPTVDVITMDVEGAEYDVLEGAREVLIEDRPVVFVSIHPPPLADWYEKTPADIHDLMASFGYRSYWIWEDHEQHWMYTHPEGRQVYL
ncbi:MAG: FkbM family methyltransferase [bacterium]|nr:FkbM family methyltransferase [bacterium]